jgi:uncharacterized protein DUF6647
MFKQTSLCAALMFLTFVGSASAQSPHPLSTSMPLEFNWLVDEPIIRNRIVTGISRLEPGDIPGQSELTSLITWVSNTVDLPAIYDLPRIERASKLKLATIEPSELLSLPGNVSSYDGMKGTIYLSEAWTGETPAELSVLVYQVARHLQNVSGPKFECRLWGEKLAYIAQAQWLMRYGRNLEEDFGIDPETYLLKTECYIP